MNGVDWVYFRGMSDFHFSKILNSKIEIQNSVFIVVAVPLVLQLLDTDKDHQALGITPLVN